MEKIEIKNKEGESLVGILQRASNNNHLAIISHGHMGNKGREFLVDIEELFASLGINSFRFDFSGHGESEGEFVDSTYTKEKEDLRSVLDYFVLRGFKNFWLVGQSQGATISILITPENKLVSYTISINGVFYPLEYGKRFTSNVAYKESLEKIGYFDYLKKRDNKIFRVGKRYFNDLVNYSPLDVLKLISTPILFVYSTNDKVISWKESYTAAKQANRLSESICIGGADHCFDSIPHRKKFLTALKKVCYIKALEQRLLNKTIWSEKCQ